MYSNIVLLADVGDLYRSYWFHYNPSVFLILNVKKLISQVFCLMLERILITKGLAMHQEKTVF